MSAPPGPSKGPVLKHLPSVILTLLRDTWELEPARIVALTVAGVVATLDATGLVVPQQDVLQIVLTVLPILLGGEAVRSKVSPS